MSEPRLQTRPCSRCGLRLERPSRCGCRRRRPWPRLRPGVRTTTLSIQIDPAPEAGGACRLMVRGPEGRVEGYDAVVLERGQVRCLVHTPQEGAYEVQASVQLRGILYHTMSRFHIGCVEL